MELFFPIGIFITRVSASGVTSALGLPPLCGASSSEPHSQSVAMRRTKASGGMGGRSDSADDLGSRNMSYTNLAAMASEFEASSYRTVLASSTAGSSSASGSTPEALQKKAMELVQMGLKIDLNSPQQAVEYYKNGADLLSQALEAGFDLPQQADEMQRTLDMVEERVREITSATMSRPASFSDSQKTTAAPQKAPEADPTLSIVSGQLRACNFFDMMKPDSLPPGLREARDQCGAAIEELTRCFGFQEENARNQLEHLVLLIANTGSHDGKHRPPTRLCLPAALSLLLSWIFVQSLRAATV